MTSFTFRETMMTHLLLWGNAYAQIMGDIVTPSHWDCMEGRQFSMFFDCLSRHEGRENLYRVTNSKSLTRNEYCLNYTPKDTDTDFNVTVIRLDGDTMLEQERKTVQVRVHHPLGQTLRKNVCICGGNAVDPAGEVRRTIEATSEFILTTLGAIAQEESRSISGNITLGNKMRFKRGDVRNEVIYGYRYNGEMVTSASGYQYKDVEIVEEEKANHSPFHQRRDRTKESTPPAESEGRPGNPAVSAGRHDGGRNVHHGEGQAD